MYKRSGWSDVKGIASANKVSYSTFMRRRAEGQTPEQAAGYRPLTFSENMKRSEALGRIKYAKPK